MHFDFGADHATQTSLGPQLGYTLLLLILFKVYSTV
jgi:hypothetical protein